HLSLVTLISFWTTPTTSQLNTLSLHDALPISAASHRGPRDQTGKHPVRHGVGVGRRGVVEARLVKTDTADRAVIVQVDEPPDDDFARLFVGAELDDTTRPRHPAAARRRRVVAHVVACIRGTANVRPQVQ